MTRYEYVLVAESARGGKLPEALPGVHQAQDTIGGEVLNITLPQQFYESPLTREKRGQDFKIIDPFFSIPGFPPWWDLASLAGPALAGPMGLVTGLLDTGYIDNSVDNLYGYICNEGKILAEIGAATKWEPHGGYGGPTRTEADLRKLYGDGAPSVYSERNLDVRGKGLKYSVGGPNGTFNFYQKINESDNIHEFIELKEAKNAKWFKIEALGGEDSSLDLRDIQRIFYGINRIEG